MRSAQLLLAARKPISKTRRVSFGARRDYDIRLHHVMPRSIIFSSRLHQLMLLLLLKARNLGAPAHEQTHSLALFELTLRADWTSKMEAQNISRIQLRRARARAGMMMLMGEEKFRHANQSSASKRSQQVCRVRLAPRTLFGEACTLVWN